MAESKLGTEGGRAERSPKATTKEDSSPKRKTVTSRFLERSPESIVSTPLAKGPGGLRKSIEAPPLRLKRDTINFAATKLSSKELLRDLKRKDSRGASRNQALPSALPRFAGFTTSVLPGPSMRPLRPSLTVTPVKPPLPGTERGFSKKEGGGEPSLRWERALAQLEGKRVLLQGKSSFHPQSRNREVLAAYRLETPLLAAQTSLAAEAPGWRANGSSEIGSSKTLPSMKELAPPSRNPLPLIKKASRRAKEQSSSPLAPRLL